MIAFMPLCFTPGLTVAQQDVFRQHVSAFGVSVAEVGLPESGLYLLADAQGLALAKAGAKGVVRVDFVQGSAQYRRLHGGGELLGKAVNHGSQPRVWDGTGGLGRDAFVLASLGLNVTVFERHPVVAALLADGLARASADSAVAAIAQRITLYQGDVLALMPAVLQTQAPPDVVYLDPMYPQRQKSAAVKKEMAYFHELVGPAGDDAALLQGARRIARKRVVVKRPQGGAVLAGVQPAFQYQGKSTRFDAYLPLAAVQQDGCGSSAASGSLL